MPAVVLPLLRRLAANADRLLGSAPGAGVRLGPLASHRQIAAVPQAPVGADLDEAFDVQRDFATEVTLDLVAPVDELAQAVDLLLGEIPHPRVRVDVGLGQDPLA